MILCRKCGHENADDASFCAQCNAYLEWSGQRVTGPDASPASPTPSGPPPVAAPVPAPSQPPPPSAPRPAPTPVAPSPAAPAAPVATEPVSRPPTAAPVDQPRSRRPTADQSPVRPKPTTKPPPEEPLIKAGDRICPVCGVGNDPARRFCRRCGAGLEQAIVAVPVHVPWYRRLFRRGSPERYQAGERPRSMEERGRPRRSILGVLIPLAVVVAILASVGAYVGLPDVRSQVDGTVADLKRQLMPELTDVTPTGNASTREVLDGNLVTWWEGEGDQPGFNLRFAPAVDLGVIGITSGANGDEFATFRRPSRIRLTPEGGDPVTLDLADTRDFQSFRIDLRDVARLRLQVLEARGPANAPVAIRDLEFKEVH